VRTSLAPLALLWLAGLAGAQDAPPDPKVQAVFDALAIENLDGVRRALGRYAVYDPPPALVRDAVADAIREHYGSPSSPRPVEGEDPVSRAVEAASLAKAAGAHDLRLAWESRLMERFTTAPEDHAGFYLALQHMGTPDDTLEHARRRFEASVALLPHLEESRPDRKLHAWSMLHTHYVEEQLLPRGAGDEAAKILGAMADRLEAARDGLPEDIVGNRIFRRLMSQSNHTFRLAARANHPDLAGRFFDLEEDLLQRRNLDDSAGEHARRRQLDRIRNVWFPQRSWDESRAALRQILAVTDPEGKSGPDPARLLLLEIALATGATDEIEALRKAIFRPTDTPGAPDSEASGVVVVWAGAAGVVIDPGGRISPSADHPVAIPLRAGAHDPGFGVQLTFPHRKLEYALTKDDHFTRWQYAVPVMVPPPEDGRWAEVHFDRAAWNACRERWDSRPDRAWSSEPVPTEWEGIACGKPPGKSEPPGPSPGLSRRPREEARWAPRPWRAANAT
jgi:hypothetical protein